MALRRCPSALALLLPLVCAGRDDPRRGGVAATTRIAHGRGDEPRPHPRLEAKLASLGALGGARSAAAPPPRGSAAAASRGSAAPPRLSAAARPPGAAAAPSRVLVPGDYGADPTGRSDSSDAFEAMVADAWNSTGDRPVLTNGPDLGVILDLRGGVYALSRPLRFPAAGGGNLAMRDGSLKAGPGFPPDADEPLALLMLTAANGTVEHDGDCCWYEFIYFHNLILDGGRVTGCARVHTATRVTFDEVFFTGYATTGLYPTTERKSPT